MRIYKVVKKEESPTIPLSRINFEDGFIIVTSDGEAVGIIAYDLGSEEYIFITKFKDYFGELEPSLSYQSLEELMNHIISDYVDPIEFNFIKVEK